MNEQHRKAVEEIKEMARASLNDWKVNRAETLAHLEEHNKTDAYKKMVELFGVADRLTEITVDCIGITHILTPEIVSILSATIVGITRGDVIKEVELWLLIKDEHLQGKMAKH